MLSSLFGLFPFLKTVIGDAGYQGPKFRAGVAEAMSQLKIEIVKRSDMAEGFQLLPKRWIVERTLRANDTFTGSLACLALRGHLVNFGQASGVCRRSRCRCSRRARIPCRGLFFFTI